ncbi:MAG: GAF domain-containing protein [Planctomycetota bacterium]|nr:MAG: GAF domain-containing protein [Planctomycetota bacterium]
MQSSVDALRHIASQVDRLIEAVSQGASAPRSPTGSSGVHRLGNGATAVDETVLQHFLRLVSTLDPAQLYQAIVTSALAVTGCRRGFLTLVEEGNKLRFKYLHGLDQATLGSPGFAQGRARVMRVLQSRQPLLETEGGGVLAVPLQFGRRIDGRERVGGVIYVDSPQGPLGEPQRKILRTLADHAAIALENAHIYHKSEQDRSQILRLKNNITKLYDVGRSISSTLILDELLSSVCEHVVQISRAQRGFIMLLEGEGDERRLAFKVGRDARGRTLTEEHYRYSTTLCKKAIESKQTQIMLQPVGDDLSMSMVEMELQSILVVPLVEKEEVIGLVYVDSKQSNREFGEDDATTVESLCGQAAVAIVNAKLYKEAGERERLAHELELASKIQSDLLPKEIPPVRGLELYGYLEPAMEVGGDYYDFVPHEGTRDTLTIVVGDVSGKGTGAGLVMAMARSALRSLVQHLGAGTSPLPILRSLNVELCRDIPPGMFITLNILNWDANARRLTYAPAGHEHLLVYRAATREVEKIKAGGVACGVLKQASAMYQERHLDLAPGDHLLLYTDGVTEAMNEAHEPFGLDATVALVREFGHLGPQQLCDTIYRRIVDFRGQAPPHDDITLVALRATQ